MARRVLHLRIMQYRSSLAVLLLTLGVSGCGGGQPKEPAEPSRYEATARACDDHPEEVDALYTELRRHPKAFQRFMANVARDAKDPAVADVVAATLVDNPESLWRTTMSTIDRVHDHPASRTAYSRAFAAKADNFVDVLTDNPQATARMTRASLALVGTKPAARRAITVAIRENSDRVVAFIETDKTLALDVMSDLVRAWAKDHPVAVPLAQSFDQDF